MNSNRFLALPKVVLLVTLMVFFMCVGCTTDDSDRKVAKEKKVAQENTSTQAVSDNAQNQTVSEQSAQSNSATTQMRAFIDPETGEMRAPTDAEAKALSKAETERVLKASGESRADAQPVVHPDGTVTLELDERHMKYKRVTVCEDGTVATNCQSRE